MDGMNRRLQFQNSMIAQFNHDIMIQKVRGEMPIILGYRELYQVIQQSDKQTNC
jgi:hypothetical protein